MQCPAEKEHLFWGFQRVRNHEQNADGKIGLNHRTSLGGYRMARFVNDGKVIALFNLEGSYHAIDDACPHRGGPLSEGPVESEVVTCPWHGSKFNVKSGDVLTPPARTGVSSYRVRVSGSDIEMEVEA
jgi:nitrite reductase/ring-hydroxylating ferredoxin subunit